MLRKLLGLRARLKNAPQLAAAEEKTHRRHSSAETAHLVGPGCVKIRGDVPIWQPVDSKTVSLHPRYLKRVVCYGNVDFSTAVLKLFWQQGIVISFISKDCRAVLGKLQPIGPFPNLTFLQHVASIDEPFAFEFAQRIVLDKLQILSDQVRYFQQQGKRDGATDCLKQLKPIQARISRASRLQSLLGYEGQAAQLWFSYLSKLIPEGWTFPGRRARPATDPVNALLSLGYTVATARCATMLAAYDLDPNVGFLHAIRPGRPSLACDLVEYLRIPLVDRLVLSLLGRRQIQQHSFTQEQDGGWRLTPEAFKVFLMQFEQRFYDTTPQGSFHFQTGARIEKWIEEFRRYDKQRS